ncbi:MAG TPA: mechanosensitive ion channel family protein [Polyangiales bacterium]
MIRRLLILCTFLGAATSASGVLAAPPAPTTSPEAGVPGASEDEAEEAVAPDSPRASMADFLALSRANKHEQAARYLELPRDLTPRGADLARRLKAVLDRRAWLDPSQLSPLSTGDLGDELPRSIDQIGSIQDAEGTARPIRLVRRNIEGGRWLFSSGTVAQIDGWYDQLDDRWLLENLPPRLLRPGPKELLWWQWLALPILALAGWLVGYALSRVGTRLLRFVSRRTQYKWDDELVERIDRPVALWWALGVVYTLLPWLRLVKPAHAFALGVLRGLFLVGFFWILSRLIGVLAEGLARSPWAERNRASRALIPLSIRVAQVALAAIAAVTLLSQLGYSVASLIAGLGVGGLAVALAAQKTLENLFGAFAIGADQPFREGDFVKVDDFVATVEHIGMRSTRFRTLDRTLITIPNGKLADMKVESYAARDRLRFAATLSLAYGTTPAQVRKVLEGVERNLRAQPKLWPDSVTVRVMQLGSSSIDLEIMAWFMTTDWAEFQRIREELLLSFLDQVEQAGTALALPTQRLLGQARGDLETPVAAQDAVAKS